MPLPGQEFALSPKLSKVERLYCRLFGLPIQGLRVRLRVIMRLLPDRAFNRILDAGCGRGVIARSVAQRFADAHLDALDLNSEGQAINQELAGHMGLERCQFISTDIFEYTPDKSYDLIVSVDNLEHLEDDVGAVTRYFDWMEPGGTLLVHVPHYYRRWPVFKRTVNFDVEGHIRPGYHLPELVELIQDAGFIIDDSGFSFGFWENLTNNISYWITGAREKRKALYALMFPILNAIAWLGQNKQPSFGNSVWLLAHKPKA
ncbi:MAG: class I SAM-dependent methyltransferase [Magnetococcales bacterium]|nr:class I SAM-dependent methyltransferase [Magnetococcales bacterium]